MVFDNVYDKISKDFKISIIGKWLPENFVTYVESMSNVEYLGFVDNPYEIITNSTATVSPIFQVRELKLKLLKH